MKLTRTTIVFLVLLCTAPAFAVERDIQGKLGTGYAYDPSNSDWIFTAIQLGARPISRSAPSLDSTGFTGAGRSRQAKLSGFLPI